MSKSRGNVLDPLVLNAVFGSELLRYFLLREMVFGQDCNFSFDALIQRANSDLANDLGNLLSRTIAMIVKYRDGRIPAAGEAKGDADVQAVAARVIQSYRANFEEYSFSRALESLWELISRINKYIVENEPWAISNIPLQSGKLDSVLFHAAEALRVAAVLLAPVLPDSAQTIWQQLGLPGAVRDVRLDLLEWSNELSGKTIRAGASLFPRLDPKEVFNKLEVMMSTPSTPQVPSSSSPSSTDAASADAPAAAATAAEAAGPGVAPVSASITIDDFSRVDLRVATVVEAERVKGADKLLRLVVDLGFEKRQVLAGIAKAYEPEKLIGRKVVVVANLLPRKLRGLESNGMIVAASLGADDNPVLIGFNEDVQNGARLR
jgi:methionyl-tRNA synthetase